MAKTKKLVCKVCKKKEEEVGKTAVSVICSNCVQKLLVEASHVDSSE